MRIFVCIKEIQNPEIAASIFRVDEEKKEVIPIPGLPLVTSPFDEQAVEAALRIKDKSSETKIVVVTFGQQSARNAIKRALSMGADEGILISNDGWEKIDGYGTAWVLSEAIKKAGSADLILTGRQSADWDAGIVGCGIAELLSIPVITLATNVLVNGDRVVVDRVLDDGAETIEAALPCVVTISNELGEPRKASLRETMRAAKKPLAIWPIETLGLAKDLVESLESRQVRSRLFVPVRDTQCEVFSGELKDIARQLADRLSAAKFI